MWDGVKWKIFAFQCNADAVEDLLRWLFREFCPNGAAVEQFVTSNKAGSKGKNSDITRMLVTIVQMLCQEYAVPLIRHRACDVKPWSSDKRLLRIGFPVGAKFKDARDAGRHGLYAAVHHGRLPDPLL